MTRIEFWEPAGAHERFAPHAFDGVAGQRVALRSPGGKVIGRCTVIAVRVDDGGGGAAWTVDTDNDYLPELARRNEVTLSFSPREPRSLITPHAARHGGIAEILPADGLARDPLAPGEIRIRWRDAPAVPADPPVTE